ncbi:MAG: cobalamin-dependent protein [Rubrivivax sp.]
MQVFTRGSAAAAGGDAAALEGWDAARVALGSAGLAHAADDCVASLLRTIEAEIIPRLMLAHRQPVNDDAGPRHCAEPSAAEQVAELTEIVLRRDAVQARSYVQARRHAGMTVEAVFLELLAPVAQRLGAMWEADLCDFTQVTVGLWRLQQIVHEHGAAFQREPALRAGAARRALLVPAPGSQHTFGLLMVGEFFRRAGWQVVGDATFDIARAGASVATDWFDVIGVSVGSECQVDAVASAILALRRASLNPAVAVMVGGPVMVLRPDFVAHVGADATACDAAAAVVEAERLVQLRRAAPA